MKNKKICFIIVFLALICCICMLYLHYKYSILECQNYEATTENMNILGTNKSDEQKNTRKLDDEVKTQLSNSKATLGEFVFKSFTISDDEITTNDWENKNSIGKEIDIL